MRRLFSVALVAAGSLTVCLMTAPRMLAQSPAGDAGAKSQSQPAVDGQKPAAAPQSSANPFPEDTSAVPVMPSKAAPSLPDGSNSGADYSGIPLPGDDLDPVRSPDDPAPAAANGQEEDSSSSLSGLERLLPRSGDDQPDKKKKRSAQDIPHEEGAAEDVKVGSYYLGTGNWKGALSRFESALVLDPENPEVYWGLAEAQHHLGDFANARANYMKLLDYDPDGRHGKEARKALKEPEIAHALSAPPSQPAAAAKK